VLSDAQSFVPSWNDSKEGYEMQLSPEDQKALQERLNKQDLTPVRFAQEFLNGCSDSGCINSKNKGGMRTNGGCRCNRRLIENGAAICGWLVQLAKAHVTLAHECDIYVRERNKAEDALRFIENRVTELQLVNKKCQGVDVDWFDEVVGALGIMARVGLGAHGKLQASKETEPRS
jgi:hypothetical protein